MRERRIGKIFYFNFSIIIIKVKFLRSFLVVRVCFKREEISSWETFSP